MNARPVMVSPRVLRRKLMKKSKRRRFARCGECGGFATSRVDKDGRFVLKVCRDCGRRWELYWTGIPG